MRRLKARAPALPAVAVCLLTFLILVEIYRVIQPGSPALIISRTPSYFSDLDFIELDGLRHNVTRRGWKTEHTELYHDTPWKLQAEFLHERIRAAGLPLVQFSPDDPRSNVPTPLCQARAENSPAASYKAGRFQRKVYDVFTFLDELDSLEIRLRTLDPVVDKFVLIMCEKSFMNNTVELIDVTKLPRFAPFKHKIRNVYCDLATWPLHDPSPWTREDHMRNVTMDAVAKIEDDDIAMMGDLDELPKPEVVFKVKTDAEQRFPLVLHMPLFRFSFGCIEPEFEGEEQWPGTVVTLGKYIRGGHPDPRIRAMHTSGELIRRELRNEADVTMTCAGWHCSSCMPLATFINKITQYSHGAELPQEFRDPRLARDQIETCLFGTLTRTRSLAGLPPVLFEERERFGYLLPL